MASDWREISLGDIVQMKSGGTPRKSEGSYWGGSIPWLSAKDMKSFRIHDTEDHVSELGAANGTRQMPAGATFLLVRGMTLLNDIPIVVGKQPMTFNQDVKGLLPKKGVLGAYVPYLLLGMKPALRDLVDLAGHGTGRLNTDRLQDLPCLLPNEDEQQRIVGLLSALDDRIDHNRALAANLEAIARALFKSWFVDFDPVRDKAAGKAPAGLAPDLAALFPDRFVDSEMGEIPEGWSIKTLDEAFDLNPKRTLPKGALAQYLDMSNTPTRGHIPDQIAHRVFPSGSKFNNGDTLLARITPCLENGKAAFVDFLTEQEVGWGSTEFIVMRPKAPLPAYFGYLLARHAPFKAHAISSMSGTSGRQRVQLDSLATWELVVPGQSVGEAFGNIVEPLRASIACAHAEIRVLTKLRDLLLPRLISGKLRVEDAEAALEAA